MSAESRIGRLVANLGAPIPADYVVFLRGHCWQTNASELVVNANPDYWGVRTLFELGEGPAFAQADEVYRIVADVLPAGMLPIGDDAGGNLYLLDCRNAAGTIFWWNHEKTVADGAERVASTFTAFLADLVPADDE